ncbi:MAG: prenyltransferase [Candidatus Omnitrophota bacterium]|jgi:1,4-dihydroxy-2-naphthoate octaprenyltransferase
MLKNFIRAVRLPFILASLLPFVFGSLVVKAGFNLAGFIYGLLAVAATHLSANLINDYADGGSGADWQDRKFYKFFGGSKLIQEKVLPEKFYLHAAVFFALIAVLSVILLALVLRRFWIIGLYPAVMILSWSYSAKPLQFSYHCWGELFIFILFGPLPVVGGYFIQSGIFWDLKIFLLSLPFGFLTTAILFANEVPDYGDDKKAGKLTWVSIFGPQRAFLVYYLLIGLAFSAILWNIASGYLSAWALFSFLLVFPAHRAALILKKYPADKMRLVESSKLTITVQSLVGIVLTIGAIL